MSPLPHPPRRPASRTRTRTRHGMAVLAAAGMLAGWAPAALAQGETPVTIPLSTPAVPPAATPASTIAAATVASSTPGAITSIGALGDSTSGVLTTVAPIKSGKVGAKVVLYKTPSTAKPLKTLVNGTNVKGRVVFTVIENNGAWLKVYAPVRPNGATAYVRASDLDTQFTHNWRIRIEVGVRRLTVYKGDTLVATETVAVGAKKTPTPLGHFFTEDLLKPKGGSGGAYGPFAYGLSGFSTVYQTFGAGDGRIGIHGTNVPSSLGQAVTNGCIRLSNAGITKLKEMLPLGVPVDIVA
jgi:lipoprotein-anchoring transpeptidase ErfK/SrfK